MQRTGGNGILMFVGQSAPAGDRPYVIRPMEHSLATSPREQQNELLNAAIDMALKLIGKHGAHVPFAMVIGSDGKRFNIAVDDRETQDGRVLEESLLNELRSLCGRNELKTVAFARNVEYRSADDGSHVDAIEITLDHLDDSAVTCMLPYRLRNTGQPMPGELFAIDPSFTFFRRSEGG